MREPIWIRMDVALSIHERQLTEHGGSTGLRDANLLESAMARPKNLWIYSEPRPVPHSRMTKPQ